MLQSIFGSSRSSESSSKLATSSSPTTDSSSSAASLKWITAKQTPRGPILSVNPEVNQSIFNPIGKNLVGLISIFGAARQGKSFLMNCLAGETDLFRISNERESCTQGIDVSRKLLELSTFAGDKKSNHPLLKVGFIDAEGQGDKDVSYDANLVCPILLASKCVIFNWKDSMQKDRILQLLGVMHKAAINVAEEGDIDVDAGGDQSKVFGHLHVVFRDWQYVDSTPESVKADIFKDERSADTDARLRNAIRADIKNSFKSISVWLFPAPSPSAAALATKLKTEDTSEAFRSQLKALRSTLATQLSEPMKFAGKPFTGKSIGPLVEQIVLSLNSGEAVKPMSAYANMLRCEIDKCRLETEDVISTLTKQHLLNVQKVFGDSVQLPSSEELLASYMHDVSQVVSEYEQQTAEAKSALSPDLADQISRDSETSISHMRQAGVEQMQSALASMTSSWVDRSKESLQEAIDDAFAAIEEQDLPMPAELLRVKSASLFTEISATLASMRTDASSRGTIDNAVAQLKKYFDMRLDICAKNNELMEKSAGGKAAEAMSDAMKSMRAHISLRGKAYYARNDGFLLDDFINDLNTEYLKVETSLKNDLTKLFKSASHPLVAKYVGELSSNCALLSDELSAEYKAKRDEYVCAQTETCIDGLEEAINNVTDVDELYAGADDILKNAYQSCIHSLRGWSPTSPSESKDILNKLKLHIEDLISEKEKQLSQAKVAADLKAKEDEEKLSLSSTIRRTVKVTPRKSKANTPAPVKEEVDEEDNAMEISGATSSKVSVEEQRARARAWAEKEKEGLKTTSNRKSIGAPVKGKSTIVSVDAVAEAIEAARKDQEERLEVATRALMDSSNSTNLKRRRSTKNTK